MGVDLVAGSRRPPARGSRRSQRRQAVSELREQGRYGPELRDVLPAFTGLVLALLAPMLLLAWLYRMLGIAGPGLGVTALGSLAVGVAHWRRPVVRRRGGHYTTAELVRLDDRGLRLAAARILRRDGWRVIDLSTREGRSRLYAWDRRGRELDIMVRPVAAADPGTHGLGPLREAGHPSMDHLTRVIIHRGTFCHTDVLWASRQDGIHLLDAHQLQRWTSGEPLRTLGIP